MDQNSKISKQMIGDKFIDSIISRNSLLVCLNQLLTNESISESNDILIQIYCNHFDDYVKYISVKVIARYINDGKLNIQTLCQSEYWHCLPQLCQLLSRVSNRIAIGQCLGFESLVNVLSDKLSELSESSDKLCENHCFCYICETVVQLICVTNDQNINKLLSKVIQISYKQQKRCFVYKLIDLMINIIKESEENSISMQTISIWVFQQNFFAERIRFSNEFYAFGGKCLSDQFNCDVVLLREGVLLYLMTLSSDFNLKSNSKNVIENQLKFVTEFVRNKCEKFDGNDCLIKLLIEEDEQLLSAVYCVIRLGNNQLSHSIMNALIESIDCDSSVLLDMLCDEQTATLLLKILLTFLKLNDISTNISVNIKKVLLELRDKMERLTAKQLFPYNVKPLMKLFNKLRN